MQSYELGNGGQLMQCESIVKMASKLLGSKEFRRDYGAEYAYAAGSMYKGIASKELVIRMGKAGMIGFLGTGGVRHSKVESDIRDIQRELPAGQNYGMNLLFHLDNPGLEEETVNLFLKYGIRNVEASAFVKMTPGLVRFRLKGIRRGQRTTDPAHRIIAKVSRPEIAEAFMSPAPEAIVKRLVEQGKITEEEAELSKLAPMADDVCVEADSGGHTDQGVAFVLLPAIIRLRNQMMDRHRYAKRIRVGAAGGIGTPEAAAAAFILGADFVVTGSINQCTVEAGTSDAVKDMLQESSIHDTTFAPAGDMFELGARVQVFKRGLLFPFKANKLYELYRRYECLDDMDEATKKQLQENYFRKSFEDVWKETTAYYSKSNPEVLAKADHHPKKKMALIFRWYFIDTQRLALGGDANGRVDYQIHCGPALGAFNQWVKGTELENWRRRHVDEIGQKIMEGAADLLNRWFSANFNRDGERERNDTLSTKGF